MGPPNIRETAEGNGNLNTNLNIVTEDSEGQRAIDLDQLNIRGRSRTSVPRNESQDEFFGSYSSDRESQDSELGIFSDFLIDLCDETEDEVVEVGVSMPSAPSREPYITSTSPMVGLSEMFSIGQLIDGERLGVGTAVDSIFSRIQQHLRAQALFLGQIGLLGGTTTPTPSSSIQPKDLLSHLPVRRLSGQTEATSLGSCPICLEQYKPRMQVRFIPGCGHVVHKTCMDKWILKSHRNTCPLDNIAISVDESLVILPISIPLRRSGRAARKSTSRRGV